MYTYAHTSIPIVYAHKVPSSDDKFNEWNIVYYEICCAHRGTGRAEPWRQLYKNTYITAAIMAPRIPCCIYAYIIYIEYKIRYVFRRPFIYKQLPLKGEIKRPEGSRNDAPSYHYYNHKDKIIFWIPSATFRLHKTINYIFVIRPQHIHNIPLRGILYESNPNKSLIYK